MQHDPVDAVLSRLTNVRRLGEGRWTASAPTRRDRNPSLSIRRGDDGKCLLKDFGGSTVEEIVAAIGLTMGDLFADDPRARRDWQPMERPKKEYKHPPVRPNEGVGEGAIKWFADRGIPQEIIERFGIYTEVTRFGDEPEAAICFPYTLSGTRVNVKYRAVAEKKFKMSVDGEPCFYNLDAIGEEPRRVVVVEGEMDVLALAAAGIDDVISPHAGSRSLTEEAMESAAYLFDDERVRVYLAGDMDDKGEEMMADLARRVGKERCFRVRWPDGCKDANDTLIQHGAEMVRTTMNQATPLPVDGIVSITDISDKLWRLYEGGQRPGLSTGWASLDDYYTVITGYWTVVTGQPGYGKTTFLNALAVNLAKTHNWNFGICSLETRDTSRHTALLASNYIGKPFREGFLERMNVEELSEAEVWLGEHFSYVQPAMPTIDAVLAGAKALVYRTGAKGVIIDPWNRIHHPQSMNNGDYIAEALNKISEFAFRFECHVWLVAHPTKLPRGADGKYPVPVLNQIAGSYQFEAMADNGISLGRNREDPSDTITDVHILKYRPEEVGKLGVAKLAFHRPTGRFFDPDSPEPLKESLAAWEPPTHPTYVGYEQDTWEQGEMQDAPPVDLAALEASYAGGD